MELGLAEGPPVDADAAPAVVTIGSFDGVHRGHARILERVRDRATALGAEPVVMTFDPHPRCVLRPQSCPETLTTVAEKAELLGSAGIHRLLVLPFDVKTSQWSAERFLERLCATVGMRSLVTGPDFALGHNRQGDLAFLRRWGCERGVQLEVVEPVLLDGERVSSSGVRAALVRGDVGTAARLAGRCYCLDGALHPIPAGSARDERGHYPGHDEVALAVPEGKATPRDGVYASWVRVAGKWWMAATVIMARPTPGAGRPAIEPWLLDFANSLDGEVVRCCFVGRLGEEGPDATAGRPEARSARRAAQVRALLTDRPHP
ncbi:MAG TPA: riboflavin kinase [Candidatus Dormibacteraeota bacterium]